MVVLNQISWSHGPVTCLFAFVSVFLIPAPLLILLLVDWGEKSRPAQVFSVTATDLLSVSQRTARKKNRKRSKCDSGVQKLHCQVFVVTVSQVRTMRKHAGVKKEKC